jgi:ligand-binding SRPBCC domain-containing protein
MPVWKLHREQYLPRRLEEVFSFFADARNLEAITPPWLHFRIRDLPDRIDAGAEILYRLRWHGVPMCWKTVITIWRPGVEFVDVQKIGPYVMWRHTHLFRHEGDGTRMIDRVEYRLPMGPLGNLIRRWIVAPDLERIFDYRAARIAEQFPTAINAGSASNRAVES